MPRFSLPLAWLVAAGVFMATPARGVDVLSEISVPNRHLAKRYYGRLYRFPENVRDYSEARLYGYSFRQTLPSGAVRELEIYRPTSRDGYLMATDLFANGRFSTMSHTVVLPFPRLSPRSGESYRVDEEASGDLVVTGPDGSRLVVDGETGALRPTRDFALDPLGTAGTPPRLRHRGLHLEIRAVGRSPFLRGTPVAVVDHGETVCRLSTDDVFRFDDGAESDRLRFATDEALFAFLADRCPASRSPTLLRVATAVAIAPSNAVVRQAVVDDDPPILVPHRSAVPARATSGFGGLFRYLFPF
jgi:hypothetical protein